MTEDTYIPGVCNIGPAERRRRLRTGWMGVAFTILVGFILFFLGVPPAWFLLLFFPAAMTAVGFLQYVLHFCAYFGFASLFNFADVGKTDSVQQAEFRVKDRRRAWQIIIYSICIGLAVALTAYGLFR